MTVTTTKGAAITNLDATPRVAATAGAGAPGRLKHINDYATAPAVASGTAGDSVVKLCRIPSSAKVKEVFIEAAAQGTTGAYDVGLYYSDSTVDGTAAANQGTQVNSGKAFFATAVDCSSAKARTDITNESGSYTVDKRNQPIWQAAGLSSDPGGYFDVCATNTNTVTLGGLLSLEVGFIE
jgi:hypothetical protein